MTVDGAGHLAVLPAQVIGWSLHHQGARAQGLAVDAPGLGGQALDGAGVGAVAPRRCRSGCGGRRPGSRRWPAWPGVAVARSSRRPLAIRPAGGQGPDQQAGDDRHGGQAGSRHGPTVPAVPRPGAPPPPDRGGRPRLPPGIMEPWPRGTGGEPRGRRPPRPVVGRPHRRRGVHPRSARSAQRRPRPHHPLLPPVRADRGPSAGGPQRVLRPRAAGSAALHRRPARAGDEPGGGGQVPGRSRRRAPGLHRAADHPGPAARALDRRPLGGGRRPRGAAPDRPRRSPGCSATSNRSGSSPRSASSPTPTRCPAWSCSSWPPR